ncbi:conserved exported hypothetical protein [Gammaproteobacteria bacterium]
MNIYTKLSVTLVAFLTSVSAFAVGPDFSALTGAVDFSTVGTAVLAIAALLALPLVIKKGAKMVLSAIK